MKTNILLVGFMGVGKGTIARALSKELNIYTIDTDDLIESLENKKIKKIFELEGEKYFRDLETKTSLWLENSIANTIVSTGGGFYKVANINNIGKVIYLQSSFYSIINRIKSHPNAQAKLKKRPLLQDEKKAKELFNQRTEEYRQISDYIVDVENKSIEAIVKKIKKIINKLK
jgi:shikimate kinase